MKNYIIAICLASFCAGSINIIAQSQDQVVKVKVMEKTSDSGDVKIKTSGDTKVIWVDKNDGEVTIDAKDFLIVEKEDDIKSKDKKVSVDVDIEEDEGITQRSVKINIEEKGMSKVIAWEDNGTLPEEIKEELEAEGIDISQFTNEASEEVTIVVENEETEDGTEKSVNINIEASKNNGKVERKGTVIIEEDGEEDIIKWIDQGEIPEDIKKQLEEKGVDVNEIENSGEHSVHGKHGKHGEHNKRGHKGVKKKMIKINAEDIDNLDEDTKKLLKEHDIDIHELTKEGKGKSKKVKAIFKDEDGTEKIMEWNGEGEMPTEMQTLIDKEEIEISGKDLNVKTTSQKKYRIKTIDEDGNEKVLEWDGEGEMPTEMKKLMEEEDMDHIQKKKLKKN